MVVNVDSVTFKTPFHLVSTFCAFCLSRWSCELKDTSSSKHRRGRKVLKCVCGWNAVNLLFPPVNILLCWLSFTVTAVLQCFARACLCVSMCADIDGLAVWKLASSNAATDIDSSFNKNYWRVSAGLVVVGQFAQFALVSEWRSCGDTKTKETSLQVQRLSSLTFNRQFNNSWSI